MVSNNLINFYLQSKGGQWKEGGGGILKEERKKRGRGC